MNRLSQRLMYGCSTVAFFAAISMVGAQAQDNAGAEQNNGVERVVVTASRITIAGYQSPTPVTVMDAGSLQQSANISIADAIQNLPSVGASESPNNATNSQSFSGGGAGEETVNLRNLGVLRTLVLFDGQRVVQSQITGGVDLSTIPSSLVDHVDVVTGGASAAWGSDAVAGVVNLVLNKNFTGLKANVEAGDDGYFNHPSYKYEATYGADFDGGRGHFIVSGNYIDSPDAVFFGQMPWYNSTYLVKNPAYGTGNGQPQLIHANNVGMSQESPGGLITASPANAATGTPANALTGIQFVGSSGTPAPYNFGNVSGAISTGGSGSFANSIGPTNVLSDPYHQTTLFGYGSYKLTNSIVASAQLNFGQSWTENTSAAGLTSFNNLTILSNNAYLPASISSEMSSRGITSFTLGTTNTNNLNLSNPYSFSALANSVGVPVGTTERDFYRGVFSLDGAIGDNWTWNAYYQHGTVNTYEATSHVLIKANLTNAINAVQVTSSNVGNSGLPIGSIACASTLTNPTNGCQPLDVFGTGVASQAAINYVNANNDYARYVLNEDVASGTMQGTLPWSLPAGNVAVAFGGEYRKEGGTVTAAPGGALTEYSVGNYVPFSGQYFVYEGFAEVDAPILKNNIVESLDFNGAGRMTSYSTSGLVETWKLGLTSQVNDDVRLRGTWSYDIRAPDLSELFSTETIASGSAVDPHTGQEVAIHDVTVGNPNLEPEKAVTLTAGVVLTPHWIDGLNLSLDLYSISIHGAIYTTTASNVLAECIAGVTAYCSGVVYNGSGGALGELVSQPLNAATQTTSGLDFQADYPMAFLNGTLNWHLLGNYTDEQTQTALGVKFDEAGSLGPDSLVTGGFPKFRATLSTTYLQGPWQGTIQGRFIGASELDNAWTSGVQVDNNDVPFVAYLDLRASYKWNEDIQVYAAVDNVTDVPPPSVASSYAAGANPWQEFTTRPDVYDALGRQYRVGIRVSY